MSEDQASAQSEDKGQGSSQPETYKVVVGGEESEVKLDELISGYQRQADYTQKTQGLAEDKKRFESLVEERATELYLKALEEGKTSEEATASVNNEMADDAVTKKLAALEQQIQSSQATIAAKEADSQLNSIMSGLREKYGKMDEDKVLIQFHNTVKEHDDVNQVFEELAKKSHEASVAREKEIIDEYVKAKTANPFSAGETGHSTAPAQKPAQPVDTFEQARERAEMRLKAIRDAQG